MYVATRVAYLIDFEGWIHRDCLVLWSSDVFHYDLRGDSLQMEVCGNAGCLFMMNFDRF